jgi:hypothetical protein
MINSRTNLEHAAYKIYCNQCKERVDYETLWPHRYNIIGSLSLSMLEYSAWIGVNMCRLFIMDRLESNSGL